jgi:hypothetical protein
MPMPMPMPHEGLRLHQWQQRWLAAETLVGALLPSCRLAHRTALNWLRVPKFCFISVASTVSMMLYVGCGTSNNACESAELHPYHELSNNGVQRCGFKGTD